MAPRVELEIFESIHGSLTLSLAPPPRSLPENCRTSPRLGHARFDCDAPQWPGRPPVGAGGTMQRTTRIGEHAVVIGGSMAGLLAARALSERFATVTVVERDRLPNEPEQRKGVPQARHVHAFWARPGGSRAVAAGAARRTGCSGSIPLRMPTDVAWLTAADRWTQRFDATQEIVSASRTLLECLVRRRVRAVSNVHFLPGQEVTGLLLDDDGDVRGATSVTAGAERRSRSRQISSSTPADAGRRSHSGWQRSAWPPRRRRSSTDTWATRAASTRSPTTPTGAGKRHTCRAPLRCTPAVRSCSRSRATAGWSA